jgi:putative membrane protein
MNKESKQNKLMIIIKGMVIGGTMMVPGVSGGTMAMILGIYNNLISAVNNFFKEKRKSMIFLVLFCLGGLLGMVILSNPVLFFLENYNMPTIYFFLGAIAGGIPLIIKQSKGTLLSVKRFFNIILGVILVLLMTYIPTGAFDSSLEVSFSSCILLMVAGMIAAVALVLPGISVSYLLLIIGLYDETMMAISKLYLPFLIPLGIGLILGIFLTTKSLEKAMSRYPLATYSIILGFILGSLVEVFPGIPTGLELVVSMIALVAGAAIILLLSKKEMENENECVQ